MPMAFHATHSLKLVVYLCSCVVGTPSTANMPGHSIQYFKVGTMEEMMQFIRATKNQI